MVDKRIPYLLEWQGIRWVSVEPMLEEISLFPWVHYLQWIVCGGESGARRRPFDVNWAASLLRECQLGPGYFFFRQGSGLYPGMYDELPGYGQVHEWPESL